MIQEYGGDAACTTCSLHRLTDDGAMGYVASMAYMGEIERKTAEQKEGT